MKLKIALFQQDIIWADPAANRAKLDRILQTAAGADLCVLPEMFSTGFATVPEGVAEEAPCQTLEWMKVKAAQLDMALAGSVALHENGKYYNRFYFVKPNGEVTCYDKRHLFTYSGEDKTFAAGTSRCIVEWKGVRFLLLVCYDLRFPVWIRNRKDYDAILCVASWPTVRRNAWDALLKARAIENQCFVAAVDRTGNDPSCVYSGGTFLIDPYGNVLAKCEDGREELILSEIDMDVLEAFRVKFPVLNDADDFEMI